VGIWQRRKVFLAGGPLFIVLEGVVRLWSPVASLHWSIYAVLVGAVSDRMTGRMMGRGLLL